MAGTTMIDDEVPAFERDVPSAALLDALDRQTRYDARTRQGLSNHLSMELVALDAMGADPARLEEMVERWTGPMLDERRDTTIFDAYRAEIAADGIEATVSEHLPRLIEAPSSEWFHSMIRLAYALDAGHDGQVASALTDWTNYERLLPGEPPEGGDVPALTVLRTLGGPTSTGAAATPTWPPWPARTGSGS